MARPASDRASIAVRMRAPLGRPLLQPAQVAEAVAAGAGDDRAVHRALAGAADGAAVCGQPHAVRSGAPSRRPAAPRRCRRRLHLGAAHGHRVAVVRPGPHAVAGPQAGAAADRGRGRLRVRLWRRAAPARRVRPSTGCGHSRPLAIQACTVSRASFSARVSTVAASLRCSERRAGLGARARPAASRPRASSSGSTGGCSPSSHSARAHSDDPRCSSSHALRVAPAPVSTARRGWGCRARPPAGSAASCARDVADRPRAQLAEREAAALVEAQRVARCRWS